MIRHETMLKLCKAKDLAVSDLHTDRGTGLAYEGAHADGCTTVRWKCDRDGEKVTSYTVTIPLKSGDTETNQRNAFIMTLLVEASNSVWRKGSGPGWNSGGEWLVKSLRTLKIARRISFVGDGAVLSLSRISHDRVRLMVAIK